VQNIILRNGLVYDPTNNINGEILDLCISGGKIVEKEHPGSKTIDLKGKVVMAGGIDAHTHNRQQDWIRTSHVSRGPSR
jgi:formylmethanofuran dehydrogenase subunit A